MNNKYFKHFPCPTDRFVVPIEEAFKSLRTEVLISAKRNAESGISRLSVNDVDIYHGRPFITIYPAVSEQTLRSLRTYNAFFKAYRQLRMTLFTLMRATPKGHIDSGIDVRKRSIEVVINLIDILIRAINLNRIDDVMINKIIKIHPRDYVTIETLIREFGLEDILGRDEDNNRSSILVLLDRYLLDSFWEYIRKNVKRNTLEFHKYPPSKEKISSIVG